MTTNQLQEALIREIEDISRDISLVNYKQEPAALKGYLQAISIFPVFENQPLGTDYDMMPEEMTENRLFPYFVVRVDETEYCKPKENMGDVNQAHVMIAFAIYDDNPELKGYFTLTAIMERVIMRFQRNPVLGSFFCSRTMKTAYQEDDTFPQFFGGIEMLWYLPDISVEGFI